jgi:hypothetical protein
MIVQLDDSLKWVSSTMSIDGPPDPPPIKLGDTVWVYDMVSDMKVPLVAVRVYENGEWDGNMVWTWGIS